MTRITLAERVGALAFGAFAGAILGAFAAWVVGVLWARSLSSPQVSFVEWALWGATVLGAIGFLIGSHVGALVGDLIGGFYESQAGSSHHLPTWLVVTLLIGLVLAVGWYVYG